MAAGDIKRQYAASSALVQINLDSLASSATWVAGWESAEIDNTVNKYTDYRITAEIKVAAAGIAAGQIRMYLVGSKDDTTWPDVFDGIESVETITDTEIRDAICLWAAMTETDTTVSRTYYLDCPSASAVFGGNVPRKFVVFVTHSTGAALEPVGDPNKVFITGSFDNVAP